MSSWPWSRATGRATRSGSRAARPPMTRAPGCGRPPRPTPPNTPRGRTSPDGGTAGALRLAAVRGVPARQARAQPRARRVAARGRPADGPAARQGPVHPPERGGQHLGRGGRRHHRVEPGREGPVLRAVRRQGVPAPDVLPAARRYSAHVGVPVTEDEFAAYQSLSEETEDHRWAFGTGFTDPLEGIDASVPDGVDAAALTAYCLALGDDALIYSHRLQQWMTRMPELEEETALANIALDLLGQARMLLARAGQAEGGGRREDDLAFFRDEHEFRSVRLAEHTDADFAQLAGRMLVFSAWRLALFGRLTGSADPVLAAIAAKGVSELAYHRDYAAQWVIRLGDGTPLSHEKMAAALAAIWPLTGELFQADPVAASLPGVAADPADLRAEVDAVLDTVLAAATLDRPRAAALAQVAGRSGRDGVHTEPFGYLLAELQSVARAHPDATW